MSDIYKNLITIAIIIIILVLFGVAIFHGMQKQEKVECIKLQEQSKHYTNFYLTDYQQKQCENHNIIIY